jgi:hypothetical protein
MRIRIAIAAIAIAMVGCGGGSDEGDEAPEIPGGADRAKVEVIDRWARELSAGDVEAAAELFAIPSVAQNVRIYVIESPADARSFNASLPCGATLVEARPEGELIIATFELTERPGPGRCGEGTGNEAATAFGIVDGKIAEWRRVVPDDELPGGEPAPSSSA